MEVTIYKPAKNAMQSGRAKTDMWVLEYQSDSDRFVEPLMGWTSSDSTLNQVKLEFYTSDDAIAFADNKGWGYTLIPENSRKLKPKNYSDAFK